MAPTDFRVLPLFTLTVLAGLGQEDLDLFAETPKYNKLKSDVLQAIAFVSKNRAKPQRPSIARASRLIADVLLSPTSHARGVAGLAAVNLDAAWYQCWRDKTLRKSIDKLIAVQTPAQATPAKIAAFAFLSRCLELKGLPRPPYWNHVEFFALNSLFVWPLVVTEDGHDKAFGFSYPLGLDVSYDEHGPTRIISHSCVKLGDLEHPMERSLEKALSAAKDLWLSQNGNAPDQLKKRINRASVVLDASPAGAIVEPFGPQFGVNVAGDSLEAYLAVVILGKLVGINTIPPVAISGALGAPVDRRDTSTTHQDQSLIESSDPVITRAQTRILGFQSKKRQQHLADQFQTRRLDCEVDGVAGIAPKFRWVHHSRQFDRAVFPEASLNELEAASEIMAALRESKQRNEVLFARTLSTVADIALTGQWRRHGFVRAPDIAHALLRPKPVDRGDEGVGRLRQILRNNKEAVLRLPDTVTIKDVVRALDYLNDDWRMAQDPPPAMRSFLFFRMVHDEPRARLLMTLLATIRAHPQLQRDIANAPDLERAASLVASALNTFNAASDVAPRNTPDILVFVKPTGLALKTRSPVPFDEHLEFDNLFAGELSRRLHAIPDDRWRSQLNRTRVLIVDDSPLDDLLPATERLPPTSDKKLLARLAIFRHGFSQAMAARLLGLEHLSGRDLRTWLRDAVSHDQICEIAGKYFLTHATRSRYFIANPLMRAHAHMQAALACAPYLEQSKYPGLADFEARFPEFVHEAQFHLASIFELEAESKRRFGPQRWRSVMSQYDDVRRQYQALLSCFFETKNWDLPRYAVAQPGFPVERLPDVVHSTLELLERVGVDALPAIRTTAALGVIDKYLHNVTKQSGNAADPIRAEIEAIAQVLAQAGLTRAKELAKRARRSRKASDLDQAVFAAAHVAAIAMRPQGLNLALRPRRVDKINAMVRDAVLTNDKLPAAERNAQLGYCPPPEWYVRYAGSLGHNQHRIAIDLYRIGREHRRSRVKRSVPLFVNALGIVEPGSQDETLIWQDLLELRATDPKKFADLVAHVKAVADPSPHWSAGASKFKQWLEHQIGHQPLSDQEVDANNDDVPDDDDMYPELLPNTPSPRLNP